MNSITRWNPMRELANMQTAFDRFFEDWKPFEDFPRMTGDVNWLALDIHEDDTGYSLTTDLPGVLPENIHVRQDGDYLLIEADIPEHEIKHESERALVKERRSGHYSRRVRLPQNIDFDKTDASYENGVLTLKLPKTEKALPRTIEIRSKN